MAIWTDGAHTWCDGARELLGKHAADLWRVNANTHQMPSGFAASSARQMVAEAQRAERARDYVTAIRALELAQAYLADNLDTGTEADRAEIERALAIYTGRTGPIPPPGK